MALSSSLILLSWLSIWWVTTTLCLLNIAARSWTPQNYAWLDLYGPMDALNSAEKLAWAVPCMCGLALLFSLYGGWMMVPLVRYYGGGSNLSLGVALCNLNRDAYTLLAG